MALNPSNSSNLEQLAFKGLRESLSVPPFTDYKVAKREVPSNRGDVSIIDDAVTTPSD